MSGAAKLYDEPADGHAPDIGGTVRDIKDTFGQLQAKAAFYKAEYEARMKADAEEREGRPAVILGGLLTFLLGLGWGLSWLRALEAPPPGLTAFWASGFLAGAGAWLMREAMRRG